MSLKLLGGVAHDLAGHAQSATSSLHPHLARACREASSSGVEVNVMPDRPYPEGLPLSNALRGAIDSVRQHFTTLLSAHGLTPDDVRDATLTFRFVGGSDDYDCAIRSTIIDRNGHNHTRELGFVA